MSDYRRYFRPGGSFFFTVVTKRRRTIFSDTKARELLRTAITDVQKRWPFAIDAIVLMPDHLHTIWTVPEEDDDYSRRWAVIKRTFTQSWLCRGGLDTQVSQAYQRGRRRGVWQRRFWEHMLRDDRDFEKHCDYIHFNPVKHAFVRCPHEWTHSTFDRFVRNGYCRQNWYCVCPDQSPRQPDFDDLDETAME